MNEGRFHKTAWDYYKPTWRIEGKDQGDDVLYHHIIISYISTMQCNNSSDMSLSLFHLFFIMIVNNTSLLVPYLLRCSVLIQWQYLRIENILFFYKASGSVSESLITLVNRIEALSPRYKNSSSFKQLSLIYLQLAGT